MDDFLLNHVLIVDDEEEYRVMIEHVVVKSGRTCDVAMNAFEALDKLHSRHFDLVVSDIRMPGKDGIELMREARTIYPHLDFVIMTGFSGEYSYSDIIAAGATDFISKPLEIGKFISRLERIEREKKMLLEIHDANERLKQANLELASTNEQIEEANRQLEAEITRRRRVEEELRKAQAELEVLIAERTEKLDRAGNLLKRSIEGLRMIAEEE